MTTPENIIRCFESNLAKAKTKAMQEFCRKELAGYKARLAAKKRPAPEPPRAFMKWLNDDTETDEP